MGVEVLEGYLDLSDFKNLKLEINFDELNIQEESSTQANIEIPPK
jgi:hypothetical protein